jgi:hypothetical protein
MHASKIKGRFNRGMGEGLSAIFNAMKGKGMDCGIV